MIKKVLIAGLGNMGFPMTKNLAKLNKYEVFAEDVVQQRIQELHSFVN